MEQKKSAAAERLAALIDRYPEDKFIWIMPRLDLAGDLPEHLDFMVSTRKLHSGDIYPQGAGVALKKSALMALAADAGLKWVSHLSRRTDDGSDPDIVEWQSTAMIADLGGLTPITRSKRIDLNLARMRDRAKKKTEADMAKDDMQRQQFKCEMAESGAATRVVRDALGIPNIFDIEDIKNKEFAILRVILSPKAKTSEERKLILGRMMDQYMPAFPTAEAGDGAVLIEAPPERPQIEGPRTVPEEIEFTIDDDSSDPAEVQQNAGRDSSAPTAIPRQGEVVTLPASDSQPKQVQQASPDGGTQSASDPLPLTLEPLPPSGSSKAAKIDFLQAVAPLKGRLLELLGAEEGAKEYYKLLLQFGGTQHADKLDHKHRPTFYRKLEKMVALIAENAPKREPDAPFAEALEMARGGYEKLAIEKLVERLEAQMEIQEYPTAQDPLGVLPAMQSGDKAACVEAAVRLMERGMMQTKAEREGKKGGASK